MAPLLGPEQQHGQNWYARWDPCYNAPVTYCCGLLCVVVPAPWAAEFEGPGLCDMHDLVGVRISKFTKDALMFIIIFIITIIDPISQGIIKSQIAMIALSTHQGNPSLLLLGSAVHLLGRDVSVLPPATPIGNPRDLRGGWGWGWWDCHKCLKNVGLTVLELKMQHDGIYYFNSFNIHHDPIVGSGTLNLTRFPWPAFEQSLNTRGLATSNHWRCGFGSPWWPVCWFCC